MNYERMNNGDASSNWFVQSLKQLKLLLWKNSKLQMRSIISTVLEIFVPALFAIILIPIRRLVTSNEYLNDTLYRDFLIDQIPTSYFPQPPTPTLRGGDWSFAFYPNNSDLLNRVMNRAADDVNLNVLGFPDENSMIQYISQPDISWQYLGAASFINESLQNFTYKLRYSSSPRDSGQTGLFKKDLDWKTNLIYSLFPILGPREKDEIEGGDPGYYREGFIQVQKAIEFALITETTNQDLSKINLKLQRFPYPPYNDDKFVAVIQAIFPFIIIVSFIFTVILTAKAIVYEKETGIKEAMKLMGMKSWVYWLSWYIKTFVLLIPSLLFMIVSYKIKLTLNSGGKASIIDKTDPILFTLFLILYVSSSITFTFLCTAFFKKANSAAAGAGVIWFFTYLPYIFISLRYQQMTLGLKIFAAFINNLAMSEGIQLIGMFEGKGTGINFSNWTEGLSVDDSFSLFQVMIVMFFNNFIHLGLLYYFENVLPGDHGIAKPWHFPFTWMFQSKKVESSDNMMDNGTTSRDVNNIRNFRHSELENGTNLKLTSSIPVFIEDESAYSSRKIGIKIRHISKKFKQLGMIKKAVNDLSLNIYEGQITVLLGHNGAGKSTTISMITGLTEPTGGNILINDLDIVNNTKEARRALGYCPQHNLLFDDLTVYEHLKFFSKLKENFDETEIDNMLNIINLSDKKHALAKTLSGGMKRKLSVAIAFIGGSSIVILDEPSSGMDPQARHSTWSLLQKFKKERKCTILLTTHFMDEADFLGDRIAIMSKGSLRCCGSPLFLKSKYGSGYNLVLTKRRNDTNQLDSNNLKEDANVSANIINLVKHMIPNAVLSSNINSEISFTLATEDSDKFSGLFERLNNQKDSLNILNIGISVTTLEEVFLRIGDNENSDDDDSLSLQNSFSATNPAFATESINPNETRTYSESNNDGDYYGLWVGSKPEELQSGAVLLLQQFMTLLKKRLIHSLRNKILIISQIVIPISVLIINLIYLKYGPIKPGDSPALTIDLSRYSSNTVLLEKNLNSNDSQVNETAYDLIKTYTSNFDKYKNTKVLDLSDARAFTSCNSSRGSIDEFLSCIGRLSFNYIIDNYVVATEFNTKNDDTLEFIGHFNNQPYHVPPLAVNLISNSLFKHYGNSINNTITVINHPLPRNLQEKITDLQLKDMTGFNVASGLTFGFSFLIASFAAFLIKEKTSDAKHLQYMSGCNSNIFWISALLWDLLNYFVTIALVMLVLVIFNINEFIGGVRWIYFLSLLIIYGFAHIPQMYLFSYFFKVSATGFASLVAWNIISSQLTLTPTQILTLPQLGLVDVSKILEWIFMIIFPNFAVGQGIIDLYDNYQVTQLCEKIVDLCTFLPNPCCLNVNTNNPKRCGNSTDDCLLWTDDYMQWDKPGLGRFFTFMPLQFFIVYSIILFYEAGLLRKLEYNIRKKLIKAPSIVNDEQLQIEEEYGDIRKDPDVVEEETRISNLVPYGNNPEIFIVDRLTKHYSTFMAVKGISFTLRPSDCFGLLGVNGAGKTSTFKMITGDEFITSGNAYISKTGIKNNLKMFQKQLGYCPQFDPLIDQMTVMETMQMYANLRGIRPDLINRTCLSLISLLDLKDHVKKMCYTLSGGNKRKLSVAISLIGSPLVVLLDEPTSGMDPKTRRVLWNSLNNIRNRGKSLILTTHSMDETEVLCTNIGIMVNGELKCLGNLQHLKNKYGDGYTLLAKIALNQDDNEQDQNKKIKDFISFITSSFTNSVVKENRDGFINIHINDNSIMTLSNIFSLIENVKLKYSIEYYVVTQTKLEQIFLNFASRQIDPATRVFQKKSIFNRITSLFKTSAN